MKPIISGEPRHYGKPIGVAPDKLKAAPTTTAHTRQTLIQHQLTLISVPSLLKIAAKRLIREDLITTNTREATAATPQAPATTSRVRGIGVW